MNKKRSFNRPVIWAIGGLPGTGKSSLGRRLESAGWGIRISSDGIRQEAGFWNQYSPADKQKVYQLMMAKIREQVAGQGQSVIAEATFIQPDDLALLQATADSLECTCRLIWLEADEETLLQRVGSPRADSQADGKVLRSLLTSAVAPESAWIKLRSDLMSPAELVKALSLACSRHSH